MNRKIIYSICTPILAIIISIICYGNTLQPAKPNNTNSTIKITYQGHTVPYKSLFGSFQEKQKNQQRCIIRIKAWDDAFAIDVPFIWSYSKKLSFYKKIKAADYKSYIHQGNSHLVPLRGPPAYTV